MMGQHRRPFVLHERIGFLCACGGRKAREAFAIKAAQGPHRGAAHQRRCIGQQPLGLAASDASPELPIAISTLRTKRSRPVRLIGDLGEQRLRNAASSSRASSARLGARNSSRARASPRGLPARTCSTGRRRGNRRSRRCDCPCSGRSSRGIGPFVLDREIGDAAPRIEPVGRRKRRRRADVEAGAAACRNDPRRGRPPAVRAW